MSRTSKVLAVSVPPATLQQFNAIARSRRSTKSELFREMFRLYQRYRSQSELEEEIDIMKVIEEVKAEEAIRPTPLEELRREDAELRAYGQKQAKKLGIKAKDINRIVREHRAEQARRKA